MSDKIEALEKEIKDLRLVVADLISCLGLELGRRSAELLLDRLFKKQANNEHK